MASYARRSPVPRHIACWVFRYSQRAKTGAHETGVTQVFSFDFLALEFGVWLGPFAWSLPVLYPT